MSGRTPRLLLGLTLAMFALAPACTKLEPPPSFTANVAEAALKRPDSIPAAWGNLVAVSSVTGYPELVQLWFQDSQGAIRIVAFRLSSDEIGNARVIPRS